ncbi:MFS general substrate transporter [Serendipita vermifera]|nr:MFS general substrate transporter [Serendipita vermifera]
MWLQGIAIVLPRVQVHFSVSSTSIGYLSSATFFGMMIGALLWGTLSDLWGRATVFKLTLCFSAIFGFFAFFAESFFTLCAASFLLGTAVGGSMPTDGTFASEILPRRKRHLLTSLSVFFSIGSVMAAVAALFVIPSRSCPPTAHETPSPNSDCNVQTQNQGWRYLFLTLTIITVAMFLARILFSHLHESPRFLVHVGRNKEAAVALSEIAKYNGDEMRVALADVDDSEENVGQGHSRRPSRFRSFSMDGDDSDEEDDALLANAMPVNRRRPSTSPLIENTSAPANRSPIRLVRRWFTVPLKAWYRRIAGLLTGEWKVRTLLIWGIWMSLALAYTMFNVYLPTLLEYRARGPESVESTEEAPASLSGPLWEVVIFTIGGCPGALLGAWMIDWATARRYSASLVLAAVTFATSVCCFAFVMVSGYYAIMLTTVGASLTSTTMWSILYGMTPELFVTEVRGTACGTASALSRVGGILAPLIGGYLVSVNPTLMVMASTTVFIVSCALLIWLDRALKSNDS